MTQYKIEYIKYRIGYPPLTPKERASVELYAITIEAHDETDLAREFAHTITLPALDKDTSVQIIRYSEVE
jgi:hypothetical protein